MGCSTEYRFLPQSVQISASSLLISLALLDTENSTSLPSFPSPHETCSNLGGCSISFLWLWCSLFPLWLVHFSYLILALYTQKLLILIIAGLLTWPKLGDLLYCHPETVFATSATAELTNDQVLKHSLSEHSQKRALWIGKTHTSVPVEFKITSGQNSSCHTESKNTESFVICR